VRLLLGNLQWLSLGEFCVFSQANETELG